MKQRTYLKGAGIICVIFLLNITVANGADWPSWRGPDHSGISTETNWDPKALNQVSIVWQAQVGTGFATISVANGKAYTSGNINKDTDVIYCFDAVTGQELWRHEYPEPLTAKNYEGGPNATPTVYDSKVYTLSKTGKVFCLNADTGKVLWDRALEYESPTWGFASSPVVIGDAVIYNVGSAGVGLNKDNGEIIWKSDSDKAGYTSAVPYRQGEMDCFAIAGKDMLMGLEAATGKLLWSYAWKTRYDINAADPIVSGNKVFVTSGYNHGAALLDISKSEPTVVWENKSMRTQMSGPVLINGCLYGFDDNQLTCVDFNTGEQKWTEKKPRKGSLSAAGDNLIVLGEKGTLFIVKATPDGYTEISSAEVLSGRCWTMPVLADGLIYARNAKGYLVCVDVKKK